MKKALSILLTIIMTISVFVSVPFAAEAYYLCGNHEMGTRTYTWTDYRMCYGYSQCIHCDYQRASYANITSELTKAPKCTEKGMRTYTATFIDDLFTPQTKTEEVDALGHSPAEKAVENEVPATCTNTGSHDEVVYCAVCEEELERTTITDDALGHSPAEMVFENEVPATCTKNGSFDEVIYCAVCEEEVERTTITLSKLGHEWDKGEVTKKATPTATGVKLYRCKNCTATKKVTIKKCDKYKNTMVVKGKTAKVKFTALKKKNVSITRKNAISLSNAKGKVSYKKIKGSKNITVSSKGKITVKKGLKKGTYKVKVRVSAKGNATYKSMIKTVTVTIVVK